MFDGLPHGALENAGRMHTLQEWQMTHARLIDAVGDIESSLTSGRHRGRTVLEYREGLGGVGLRNKMLPRTHL